MDSYRKLLGLLGKKEKVAIAYSGGVDSSLLALAAREALGDSCIALMAVNKTIPQSEVELAVSAADEIGIELKLVEIDVLSNEGVISNPLDRCGICKHEIMGELLDNAIREGCDVLADGSMPEDRGDHRPGILAADRLGVWHPLMEAGMSKGTARSILKDRCISTHDIPSTTCLMTRIPYGERITVEKLEIIERIESILRKNGFREIRLRLHEGSKDGHIGVLEVDDPDKAVALWKDMGISEDGVKLTIDPLGYRQGSLNRP